MRFANAGRPLVAKSATKPASPSTNPVTVAPISTGKIRSSTGRWPLQNDLSKFVRFPTHPTFFLVFRHNIRKKNLPFRGRKPATLRLVPYRTRPHPGGGRRPVASRGHEGLRRPRSEVLKGPHHVHTITAKARSKTAAPA